MSDGRKLNPLGWMPSVRIVSFGYLHGEPTGDEVRPPQRAGRLRLGEDVQLIGGTPDHLVARVARRRVRLLAADLSRDDRRAVVLGQRLRHRGIDRPTDGVVLLTLDNPEQRNAMSDEMTASWVAAIDELAADRSVRAVVVTGAGSAFCSGGNTGWIASEPEASAWLS